MAFGLFRECVRCQDVGAGGDVFHERLVRLVGDDRQTLGHSATDPAGMIEMVVRVDDVSERLVRLDFPRLGDDREGAAVMPGRFDERQVIGEFDEQAVMRLSGEQPDPPGEFVSRDGDGRRRGRRRSRGRAVAVPASASTVCVVRRSSAVVQRSVRW
jgi:hypothetical protein